MRFDGRHVACDTGSAESQNHGSFGLLIGDLVQAAAPADLDAIPETIGQRLTTTEGTAVLRFASASRAATLRSSETPSTGVCGSTPPSNSTSDLKTLPMPASAR